MDLQLKLVLAKGYFGIEKIKVVIRNANLTVPPFSKTFQLKYLQGEFSPDRLTITKADLLYDQTMISVSGTLNPKEAKLDTAIVATRINLADWIPKINKTANFQITGLADVQLKISGLIRDPDINGAINLDQTGIIINHETEIAQISGRILVAHNDLRITSLKGIWDQSKLEISGRLMNLFHPKFQIKFASSGFQLQDLPWIKATNFQVITGKQSVLQGEITGSLQNPQLDCRITFDRLVYKEIFLTELAVRFIWNPGGIRILQLNGNVWEGRFTAAGSVTFEPAGIKWMISGKVSNLDLEEISIINPFAIRGWVSTDVVLRGSWLRGEPFQVVSAFGTFTGNDVNFRDALVDEVNGVFSWNNGILTIDSVQAQINQGLVFGSLQLNRQSEITIAVNAEDIKLRDLFPDVHKVPFDGIFNGSFDFRGPVNRLIGDIHGAFTKMTWNSKPIGDITGDIAYRDHEFTVSNIRIASELGSFLVKGQIDISREPYLNINVTGIDTNLKGLAGWLPLRPFGKNYRTGAIQHADYRKSYQPQFSRPTQINQSGDWDD